MSEEQDPIPEDDGIEEFSTDGAAQLQKSAMGEDIDQDGDGASVPPSAFLDADGEEMNIQDKLVVLERTVGPAHPDTLACAAEIGKLRMEIADYQTAVVMYDRVVYGYTALYGPGHRKTLRYGRRLASAQKRLEKVDSKRTSMNRFFFFLLWGPGMIGAVLFAWEYVETSGVAAVLHDGPCSSVGLCTPYATQLEAVYEEYSGFRRVEQLAKIKAIPSLLRKWKGKEGELVEEVTDKYGVSKMPGDEDMLYTLQRQLGRQCRRFTAGFRYYAYDVRTKYIRTQVQIALALCFAAAVAYFMTKPSDGEDAKDEDEDEREADTEDEATDSDAD